MRGLRSWAESVAIREVKATTNRRWQKRMSPRFVLG
jgi:hypothetical protein